MSKNTIIGLAVADIVVIGGGYYFMSSGSYSMMDATLSETAGEPSNETNDVNKEVDKATPKLGSAFSGSFFDLGTRGGNYTCSVSSAGAANGTTGTVYVSGTSMRGDFSSVSNGASVESHMLKVGDTMYVWGGAMEQGIMMKATAMQGQGSTATQGTGVSGTQEYGWDCRADRVDASKFAKPSGIDFIDTAAMMQGAIPGAGMMPKIPTGQ